jgi:hypothetical protein
LSSHVGPDVGGLALKEEKVEQEVPGGLQDTSFEELNLEQGCPSACSARGANMNYFILFYFILYVMYCACTCRILLIDGDRLHGSTLSYIILD